ncbi:MAG: ABC transporter permease [Anaerolineae bacterium]
MRNIFLVIRHEIVTTLGKRSFWIMTFIFPAVIIVLNVGAQAIAADAFEQSEAFLFGDGAELSPIGYVDEARLISRLPEGFPPGLVQSFPDEAAARTALETGELDQYFLVPADFVETGDLILVGKEFRPINNPGERLFRYILLVNLTGDSATAAAALDPIAAVDDHALAPQGGNDLDNPFTFIVPFATMFIFFILITTSSGFMLQSVSREKENRTVEILLLSLRPRELMLGKVLGLSVVALLQMTVWMGGGLAALDRSRQLLETAAAFVLPPGFLVWAVLYFLLGYLLYASLMGALGALAPNAREGGQFTFVALLPLLIPVWINPVFISAPNGVLATALSLFPLTAPTSMMTRLAHGGVPLWQPAASLAGLAVTTYLFVLLSARFFRADTLLSTAAFNWRRLFREFRAG